MISMVAQLEAKGSARGWRTAVNRLLSQPSFEVAPGQEQDLDPVLQQLHPDTYLFIPNIASRPLAAMVNTMEWLAPKGFDLVPHIAARNFGSRDSLHEFADVLSRLNVRTAFIIGGGVAHSAGPYNDAEELLAEINLFADSGVEEMGFAGYPEGHPTVPLTELNDSLARKVEIAKAAGIKPFIVTQFCFEAEPIIAWERASRELFVRPVPVVVGLPGVTSVRQLLRYAKICGVQASTAFLTGHAASMLTMLRRWSPDKLVQGIGAAVAEDTESRIERFHFFPFGALDQTTAWISDTSERNKVQGRSVG